MGWALRVSLANFSGRAAPPGCCKSDNVPGYGEAYIGIFDLDLWYDDRIKSAFSCGKRRPTPRKVTLEEKFSVGILVKVFE
jgi:hypothetical protein